MNLNAHKIISYSWILVGVIWLITSVISKPAVRVQSTGSRAVQVVLTVLAFLLLFDKDLRVGPLAWRFVSESPLIWGIGAALTIAGIVFAIGARFFLGTNWSSMVTVKENHQLIRRGPYAIVRHPIYSGLLLALAGTALAFGEIRGLLAIVLATVGFRLKSLTEESFMVEQFGAEYVQYRRDVKALIPFIW